VADVAEVLLLHHVQGLTPGVLAFADELRRAGHVVHTPDLFDGRMFDTIPDGAAFADELAASTDRAELFLYPGDEHLFADASLPSYDADATELLLQRVHGFLDSC
jgi:dienelactone hydrolase